MPLDFHDSIQLVQLKYLMYLILAGINNKKKKIEIFPNKMYCSAKNTKLIYQICC